MKDIGSQFEEKRREIGIKLEEAASDLEITVAQLENLEDGNVNAFKDIFFLKELIKKYAIYLNLDDNKIMDEFNDFVFDFTSKIPVEEIEEKVKEIVTQNEKETRKKISSPYTRKKVRKAKLRPVYVFTLVTVLLVSITFILLNAFLNKQKEINYVGSEIFNEYTK